jgi:hypothetical protein
MNIGNKEPSAYGPAIEERDARNAIMKKAEAEADDMGLDPLQAVNYIKDKVSQVQARTVNENIPPAEEITPLAPKVDRFADDMKYLKSLNIDTPEKYVDLLSRKAFSPKNKAVKALAKKLGITPTGKLTKKVQLQKAAESGEIPQHPKPAVNPADGIAAIGKAIYGTPEEQVVDPAQGIMDISKELYGEPKINPADEISKISASLYGPPKYGMPTEFNPADAIMNMSRDMYGKKELTPKEQAELELGLR